MQEHDRKSGSRFCGAGKIAGRKLAALALTLLLAFSGCGTTGTGRLSEDTPSRTSSQNQNRMKLGETEKPGYVEESDGAPAEEQPDAPDEDYSDYTDASVDCVIEDGVLVSYSGEGEKIILPEGITAIGENAFKGKKQLFCVYLPDGLLTIGKEAFYGCKNLRRVRFPDGLTVIGENAFSETDLDRVVLPDSVETIGDYAFYSCKIREVRLPDGGGTTLGTQVFGSNLLQHVVIPAGITAIGDGIFIINGYLEDITVDPGNRDFVSVDNVLFSSDMTRMICYPHEREGTTYTVPDGVETLAFYAFSGSVTLTEITLPDTLTTIKGSAFKDCTALTEIVIPDSCETIKGKAFQFCGNLTRAVIPASVTEIGEEAFSGCPNLTIYGMPGSIAESYASEQGIPFVAN